MICRTVSQNIFKLLRSRIFPLRTAAQNHDMIKIKVLWKRLIFKTTDPYCMVYIYINSTTKTDYKTESLYYLFISVSSAKEYCFIIVKNGIFLSNIRCDSCLPLHHFLICFVPRKRSNDSLHLFEISDWNIALT